MQGVSDQLLALLEVPEIASEPRFETSARRLEALSLIDAEVEKTRPSSHPKFIHLAGVPGSGKSSYSESQSLANPNFYVLRFDGLMEQLTSYREDFSNLGAVQAFSNWEIPARTIGYHLLAKLIATRRNVLFDHSAAASKHLLLLNYLKQLGYRVEMHYLECNPPLALERVRARNLSGGRYTPEQLVFDRHELLEEYISQYKRIVDFFQIISTDS